MRRSRGSAQTGVPALVAEKHPSPSRSSSWPQRGTGHDSTSLFGDAARGTLLLILGSLEEGSRLQGPSRNKQGCAESCQPSSRGTVDLDNLNLAILGCFLAGPRKRFGLSLRTPPYCLYLLVSPMRDFLKHLTQNSTLTNKDCHERLETQTQRA